LTNYTLIINFLQKYYNFFKAANKNEVRNYNNGTSLNLTNFFIKLQIETASSELAVSIAEIILIFNVLQSY